MLVLMNSHHEDITVKFPASNTGGWTFCLSTSKKLRKQNRADGSKIVVQSRSLAVFTAKA